MFALDTSLESYFYLSPNELKQRLKIPIELANTIHHSLRQDNLRKVYENYQKRFHIITIFDKQYPNLLRNIPDPPYVIYGLGNVSLLQEKPSISVIGTRRPSEEASRKLHFIVTPLVKENWIIVSGLAYGIDSAAHQLSLKYSGRTIAVMGSGFEHIYPAAHKGIFNEIANRGLAITEYPPHVRPQRYHFPERNRIISGLTEATLVIEAMEKSGTLITVDQALEQGKDVYAVPGSIFHPQTIGCHQMIQDGAKLVTNSEDIKEDWITRQLIGIKTK